MASQVRKIFCPESLTNALQLDNQEFILNQHSAVQFGEDIYTSPSAQLNFPPNGNGSLAKQELQTLWEIFTSWLQPEKQSKEQMISQLVLEQFLITGYCKDKFALKENWESSGRNMRRFMEGLTDECLKPPTMVHVSMQGQEALFSENMPLKEVIEYLKQQATPMPTQENPRTYMQIQQDNLFLATGNENSDDGCNNPWNATERNSGVNSSEEEMGPLLIIQTDQYAEPKDRAISFSITQSARETSEGTFRYPVESLQRAHSSEDIAMEVKPGLFFRIDQTKDNEDSLNTFWNASEVNHDVSIPAKEIDSKTEECSESEETTVPYGVVDGFRRAPQGTSKALEYLSRIPSSDDAPVQVLRVLSQSDLPPCVPLQLFINNGANSTSEFHQERLQRDLNTYTYECPQTFK